MSAAKVLVSWLFLVVLRGPTFSFPPSWLRPGALSSRGRVLRQHVSICAAAQERWEGRAATLVCTWAQIGRGELPHLFLGSRTPLVAQLRRTRVVECGVQPSDLGILGMAARLALFLLASLIRRVLATEKVVEGILVCLSLHRPPLRLFCPYTTDVHGFALSLLFPWLLLRGARASFRRRRSRWLTLECAAGARPRAASLACSARRSRPRHHHPRFGGFSSKRTRRFGGRQPPSAPGTFLVAGEAPLRFRSCLPRRRAGRCPLHRRLRHRYSGRAW